MSRSQTPALVVAAVGRARPPHEAASAMYEERIARYTMLSVIEVAAEPLQAGEEVARRREAERLRARLPAGAYRVALTPQGRTPRSDAEFATRVARLVEDPRPACFLIGGAAGLAAGLVAECEETLSLGPLTLPHQLARVLLTEQLYRALAAHAGHPYAH